jgi:hypothetical protein
MSAAPRRQRFLNQSTSARKLRPKLIRKIDPPAAPARWADRRHRRRVLRAGAVPRVSGAVVQVVAVHLRPVRRSAGGHFMKLHFGQKSCSQKL